MQAVSKEMYENTTQQPEPETQQGNEDDDDVIDAEFEEV